MGHARLNPQTVETGSLTKDKAATMRLAQFIRTHSERIISEWESFATTSLPSAAMMDLEERRDHIAEMLDAVARDLDTPQTDVEQAAKARGMSDAKSNAAAATLHGSARALTGFSATQVTAEFRALRASILRLWFEEQGEFDHAMLEDVTRFNEAIDQLLAESMANFSRDVERAKDLLLGVTAHDLRNPLGSIMAGASSILTRTEPSSPVAKTAVRMISSIARMDAIIGDLIDFARARLGGGISITPADMDLETTCRQVIDEIVILHPGCRVNLVVSGSLHGRWDPGRIGRLLSNLVSNAYQHGAANLAIEVALRGEPEEVVVSVHNRGSMIAASDLRRIFAPFRQLKPAEARSKDPRSVGLGLFIVQAIVMAHHGTIEVESTEQGTTFTVHLPRNLLSDGSSPRSSTSTAEHSVH